jgi:hypothetical protein
VLAMGVGSSGDDRTVQYKHMFNLMQPDRIP